MFELYQEENEAENAFPEVIDERFIAKLESMGRLMFEKIERLEEEIDEVKNVDSEPFETTSISNDSCSLCSAFVFITTIKLLVILLI